MLLFLHLHAVRCLFALSKCVLWLWCPSQGLFSVAKPMMNEIFSSTLPGIVTAAFAGNYVLALSAGNLGGRLGWAALSDKIGRRPTFMMFTFGRYGSGTTEILVQLHMHSQKG